MPENQAPADAEALRKQVEDRAYALWESQGRLHGRDVADWLQAETEIMASSEAGSMGMKPSSPTASPAGRKTKAESSSD